MLSLFKLLSVFALTPNYDIEWYTLKNGLIKAKISKKPVMLLIYSPTCPACIALKKKFDNDQGIARLSKEFIMVKIENSDFSSIKYQPDGSYVPRIIFLDYNGNILTQFYNESRNEDSIYFYHEVSSIVRTMKKVRIFTK